MGLSNDIPIGILLKFKKQSIIPIYASVQQLGVNDRY